jgi:hypothetical protein
MPGGSPFSPDRSTDHRSGQIVGPNDLGPVQAGAFSSNFLFAPIIKPKMLFHNFDLRGVVRK